MVEALNFKELQKIIDKKYDYDEQRIIGIMLARYDIKITQDIIEQCYQYWHLNTQKFFDVYWAGYGKYLSPTDESSTKTILKYPGNNNRVYFDLEAFIEIKEQFNKCFNSPYEDKIQLILVNYRNGKLHFDESIKIDLEKNLDANYAKIREIMEFLTTECRSAHHVASIATKLKLNHFKDIIKGITISDVINTIISMA